jgi:hypothetical protein
MAKNNNPQNVGEEDIQKGLERLRNSYIMYEKTKAETIEQRTNAVDKNGNKKYSPSSLKDTLALIETMQQDIMTQYIQLGGDKADLENLSPKKKTQNRKKLFEQILAREKSQAAINMEEQINNEPVIEEGDIAPSPTYTMEDLPNYERKEEEVTPDEFKAKENIEKPEIVTVNEEPQHTPSVGLDPTKATFNSVKYDVIPLPSNGECYKNKMTKIPVAYLTAYDENLIVSPNLYKDGTFLDYILKSKIITNEIEADDLLPGDRDAIILWLRASGYGPEFPVTATDNATGEKFDAIVDLTKLKYKKFNLKADRNGYFGFELPFSKDKIKFKFLTYKDTKVLDELDIDENLNIKKTKLEELYERLGEYINNDTDINRSLKIKLSDSMKGIREYIDSIKADDDALFTHSVTNKLEASIVSINGISDRKYIKQYVEYMNVRDSSALRKFIIENEPGIDFNVEVQRPESLGGGSVKMFLTLDQFIFLTVA